ncbi:Staphylococcal nuclease domain-containing protein 1 [Galdieria sulphuraria]|nr:Staphylococcal nuclease domain-containing protein 1 [Galdieria sulphuraria]
MQRSSSSQSSPPIGTFIQGVLPNLVPHLKAKNTNQESEEAESLKEENNPTYVQLEPFAWDSREALRELTIGKPVIFRIGESLYGIIGSCQEDKAKEEKKGLHGELSTQQVILVTRQPFASQELPKGTKLFGLVEQVLNGSLFRMLVPENLEEAKVSFHSERCRYRSILVVLPGVQSPGFKVESHSTETKLVPQPFALNARLFSEQRLLNRVVRLDVVGLDKNGSILGEVFLVSDRKEGEDVEHYIGEDLLRAGLARTNNWGLELSPRSGQLMKAEKCAIEQRLGVWQNYVPFANAPVVLSGSFKGKVVEVIAGDTIAVLPQDLARDANRMHHCPLSLESFYENF